MEKLSGRPEKLTGFPSRPSFFQMDAWNQKTGRSRRPSGTECILECNLFPTAAMIANSWNQDLGEEIGQALGEEAASMDVNIPAWSGIKY